MYLFIFFMKKAIPNLNLSISFFTSCLIFFGLNLEAIFNVEYAPNCTSSF